MCRVSTLQMLVCETDVSVREFEKYGLTSFIILLVLVGRKQSERMRALVLLEIFPSVLTDECAKELKD